jgi:serine/threonine-protein kinase
MNASDDSVLLEQLRTGLSAAYEIERELHPGGMSRVFLAREIALNRQVVIKVLNRSLAAEISAERFAREVRLASSLQQANIVPVLTAGLLADMPYYVMPFVEGESLRALMNRSEPISLEYRIAILRDVARALAFAHDHRVVHRDIKPENILLSGGAAVVSDFGIAKAVAESADNGLLTIDGQSLGTPAYMSPEQASGDHVDTSSDVYSWGVTAYELLSKRHPFAKHTSIAALIRAHIAEAPVDIRKRTEEVPEQLALTVMRALDKEPGRRPSSGSELYAALGDIHRRRERYRVSVVAAASVLVFLIAAAAFTYSRRDTIRSVAVIPFTIIGGDTTQSYFSDGVSIEIGEALGRISGLRLASRSSAFSIGRNLKLDAKTMASRLNVGYLVEGQILRRHDTLSVSAQLTDGTTGKILWQNQYQRKEADVFAINGDIAKAVALSLHLKLPNNYHSKEGTSNVAAHDYYVRGLAAHYGYYSEENLQKAIALYDSAIALDPSYADPYARLAWAWANMADDFAAPSEVMPKVAALAQEALALDSLNAMAEISLALSNFHSGRDFTLRHAERSVRLAPNDPEVLALAAWLIAPFDWQLGKRWIDRALQLESTNQIVRGFSSFSYAMCGDPLTAIRIAAVAEYKDPTLIANTLPGAEGLMRLGRFRDAMSEWRSYAKVFKDQGRSGIARTFAELGERDSALAVVHELESESATRYVSKDYIAAVYASLREPEVAMDWLEKAEAEKANYLNWLRAGPMWKNLRGNPRYEAMIRRLGLVS